VPTNFVRNHLFYAVNHVEKLVIIYTDEEFVLTELNSARDVAVLEVHLSEYHLEFKNILDKVTLDFGKIEAVITAERQFLLAAHSYHFENCVYF
jgi:hypothetical protein